MIMITNDRIKFTSSQHSIQEKFLLPWLAFKSTNRSQNPVSAFEHHVTVRLHGPWQFVVILIRIHYTSFFNYWCNPAGYWQQGTEKTMISIFGINNEKEISYMTKIVTIKQ